jgi:hypothetical protein
MTLWLNAFEETARKLKPLIDSEPWLGCLLWPVKEMLTLCDKSPWTCGKNL